MARKTPREAMTHEPRVARFPNVVAIVMSAVLLLVVVAGVAAPAGAQNAPTCPTYEGVTCDGYVTDLAGVLTNEPNLEAQVADLVKRRDAQIAVITIDGAPGGAQAFAKGIGDAWGVDGVVIVVDVTNRKTEVRFGKSFKERLSNADAEAIAKSAENSFRGGDFDAGISTMLGSLDAYLSGTRTSSDGGDGGAAFLPLMLFGLVGGGLLLSRQNGKAKKLRHADAKTKRSQRVDDALNRLQTTGADLPDLRDYEIEAPPTPAQPMTTEVALAGLRAVSAREDLATDDIAAQLWSRGLLDVLDAERLLADCEVPFELRATYDERQVLDEAVQQSAKEALEIPAKNTTEFDAKMSELDGLVAGLRPHRVAEARQRFAQSITDRMANTDIGYAVVSDTGERLLSAAPVLDRSQPIETETARLDTYYTEAETKVDRLDRINDALPDNPARPAVAAALTDLDDDPDKAVERYEQVRQELKRTGEQLVKDRLDVDAIAALLLMNRDEMSVETFVDLYETHRRRGLQPQMAVEYAMTGLTNEKEVERVKSYSEAEGIPVAIVAAIMRSREDGIAVYKMLEKELADDGVTSETRRTIAGILAASLEPAQAERRWIEAREALRALGLTGSYADIAAAFGASDPRGPQEFALAYAAQRQALSRSSIDDADRFAPELAHAGTRGQTDSWTGQRIPSGLGSFDPFTFFYLHWVITAPTYGGGVGWEPIYNDPSWNHDSDSWFGGFGGGGGFGDGGGGGSSWGGSGWSSGSFGGFGGGGDFGGGGGGGSSW